jgi:hypothetical protein
MLRRSLPWAKPSEMGVCRVIFLLFLEKEAKSISSASQKPVLGPNLPRSGTKGVWGLAPKEDWWPA